MEEDKRMAFRPGALAGPLEAFCKEHNISPSNAIRIALSRMLGVEEPTFTVGNPEFGPGFWENRSRKKKLGNSNE